jgi:oligoendopeptidase F
MMAAAVVDKAIPRREDVATADTWDLTGLFADDVAWEEGLHELEHRAPGIDAFKGTLATAPERLLEALVFVHELGLLEERLGYYAHLRVSEDIGNSEAQGRLARYQAVTTSYAARSSFLTPEIQAIPDNTMQSWLAGETLAEYRIYLQKMVRYKPHVLSAAEERLLAMQSEFSQTARNGFSALTDVDLDFGSIETDKGTQPLTHSTYAVFIQDPDRAIRAAAYAQYLKGFHAHRHTLAALYAGSVQLDVYRARVRRFPSALAARLFDDDMPVSVYDQLIDSVRAWLPALHRYYELRKRVLKVDTVRLYDMRVPLVDGVKTHYDYEAAVELVTDSLQVLGEEYVNTLRAGLRGRWVDRYENKGKRSGAFSAGSYAGDPYILMNYKADVLNDVFTLTHEAGHSMHSWYSARHQPFQHYNYTIFVAEVASTFNEQLLAEHLLKQTDDPRLKAYLVNKQVDDLLATVFRQTLFAEFERETHAMVERNEPLTVDSLCAVYADLLRTYFGPDVPLEEHSALEGLRIPHFYSAFYVYQYATGLAAAIALYEQVRTGDVEARDRYLRFLQSGGSAYPLVQLKEAGVDMTTPAPVTTALERFQSLVRELETLIS